VETLPNRRPCPVPRAGRLVRCSSCRGKQCALGKQCAYFFTMWILHKSHWFCPLLLEDFPNKKIFFFQQNRVWFHIVENYAHCLPTHIAFPTRSEQRTMICGRARYGGKGRRLGSKNHVMGLNAMIMGSYDMTAPPWHDHMIMRSWDNLDRSVIKNPYRLGT